ncbi:DUF1844 domain-containing protein [candidate division KSB1 bacterium]|nr:DUF1844 domain-containing protein [candidate division KSB1 bacterium]
MTNDRQQQALFFQMIMSFQAAAMQHLGQIENMFSNKIEYDLEQARIAIDMIDMIRKKTEGNRTPEETTFIEDVLRELRLIYVKVKNSQSEQNSK